MENETKETELEQVLSGNYDDYSHADINCDL